MITFPIEKILTISATEWFNISGGNPRCYDAVGVHDFYNGLGSHDVMLDFIRKIPETSEVVVNYKQSLAGFASGPNNTENVFCVMAGTAIVPKKAE